MGGLLTDEDMRTGRRSGTPFPQEIEEAKLHPDGWVYRIAGRFGENDRAPPEAIVGAWRVDGSGVISGEFMLNPKYDPAKYPQQPSAMRSFVERMLADQWTGTYCLDVEISRPEKDDVIRAIDALDARVRTIVTLHRTDGAQMTIGGGSGKYVAYFATSDQDFWNLLAERDTEGLISLNAGGQVGDFPARQVIDKQQAIRAASTFLEKGELDATLRWEKQ